MKRENRESAILSELRIRTETLRAREFGELQQLPKWQVEETVIADVPVEFTTFCEHQANGSLFVVIQSDARIYLGGLVVGGSSEGFFVQPNGEQRIATDTEIQDFFS